MSRIRSRDTTPEKEVRKILSKLGFRYRVYVKGLCGKPDIVISKIDTIIFINGCFWHQHERCKRSTMPKTNQRYWKPKLKRNTEKQKLDIKLLKKDRWRVYIVWECETKDERNLKKKLQKIL